MYCFRRERKWRFNKGLGRWVRIAPENEFVEISSTHEKAIFCIFDQTSWTTHRRALVLPLDQFEKPEDYQC